MYQRFLMPRITEAMADTPVVVIAGARQTGKTTIARELVAGRPGALYFTLDDAATLAAASEDPVSFVRQAAPLTVIDEIQKAPALLPAIKVEVDHDRRPGRFLLTGSAHPLVTPRISESLAGRMELLVLRPLSRGELTGNPVNFVDRVFDSEFEPPQCHERLQGGFIAGVRVGGYPEVRSRKSDRRRDAWFASYVTAILQRDVRDLANIEGLAQLPRLLSFLAVRSGSLLNKAEASRSTGFSYSTLERYLALLEATFLLDLLPAWAGNLGKRLTRSPKVFLGDSGLTGHLAGVSAERIKKDPALRGALVECWAVAELRKMASWATCDVGLWHFRAGRQEVDIVLEDRDGRVVGIEVKSGSSLSRRVTAGLKALAGAAADRFHRGIVLYGGDRTLPLGTDIWAVPLAVL